MVTLARDTAAERASRVEAAVAKHRARLAKRRLDELEKRCVALSAGPAHVTLEMTTRCNLSCVHCRRFHVQEEDSATRGVFGEEFVHDIVGTSGYMDAAVFERSFDLVRDAEWVSLCGYGEPLLHPRFFEYAERLKARGHVLDTITNGTLLTDKHVRRLVDMGFDQISVSIDGAEDETLQLVRGVGAEVLFGGLERIAREKRARGLGPHDAPRISVNFAMGRFNIREMPALARKLVELDAHVFYAHILETAAWPEALGPQLIYTDPEVREEAVRLAAETRAICEERGVHVDIRHVPEVGSGYEADGVPLDRALDALERAAEEHAPPRRSYLPLAAIAQRRRNQAAAARRAAVAATNETARAGRGCPTAGPDTLTAREKKENEQCLDLFRYAFVTWSGKVLSCCFERFGCGDLNLQTADEVWNGPVYQRLRRGYFEDGLRWVCHGCARTYSAEEVEASSGVT
jgi:MoaA/NifB/PqqE/SkfB family radical SAM enzyme